MKRLAWSLGALLSLVAIPTVVPQAGAVVQAASRTIGRVVANSAEALFVSHPTSTDSKLVLNTTNTKHAQLGLNVAPAASGGLYQQQLADNTMHAAWLDGYSGLVGSAPTNGLTFRTARTTPASPSGVKTSDQLGFFSVRAHNGTAFTTGSRGAMAILAAEDWTATANGTKITFNTTANTTTTNATKATLDNDGSWTVTGYLSGTQIKVPSTDSSATPGDATANTARGKSAIPGDSTTLQVVITNSLVTTASTVLVVPLGSGGANLRQFQLTQANGSFTFRINSTVATPFSFNWYVIN